MGNKAIQAMDLTSLKAVIADLRKEILPSRFEKAQQPHSDTIQLGFRTLKGLSWVEISWDSEAPRLVEINSPQRAGEESTLAKQIQYGLRNMALVEIQQNGFERIVKLGFSERPKETLKKILVLELMGRHSNLFLIDQTQKIITIGRQIRENQSRFRPISTGDTYKDPPALKGLKPNKEESFERWKGRLSLVPISLRKALAESYQGISPSLALQIASDQREEAEKIINLNVDKISFELWEFLFSRWIKWLSKLEQERFTLKFKGATDFNVWDSTFQESSSEKRISLVLGSYYQKNISLKRIEKINNTLKQQLSKLKKNEKSSLLKQENLLLNINEEHLLKSKADQILCSNKPTKSEIEEAQKLYKKSKKLKRSFKIIKERIYHHQQRLNSIEESEIFIDNLLESKWEKESDRLKKLIDIKTELEEYLIKSKNNPKKTKGKKTKTPQPLEINTASGSLIQIGRNHRQNEYISLKKAKKGDLWFHAQECPGSHVVLKSSIQGANESDLQLAADLAALFSRAKGNKIVPVILAPAEQLQRIPGALPGTVIHKNGTVVWGRAERALQHIKSK
tara:strand:- start:17907 stop:19610 length:1704 start_codon:yes stop_codon:yes gene_type:complete